MLRNIGRNSPETSRITPFPLTCGEVIGRWKNKLSERTKTTSFGAGQMNYNTFGKSVTQSGKSVTQYGEKCYAINKQNIENERVTKQKFCLIYLKY